LGLSQEFIAQNSHKTTTILKVPATARLRDYELPEKV